MQPTSHSFEQVFTTEEKTALRGERFSNREFIDVDFSGADLRDASFERTVFVRCNLAGADLRAAKFILCELRQVVFSGSLLGDNRFDGSSLVGSVGLHAEHQTLIERAGGSFQQSRASLR